MIGLIYNSKRENINGDFEKIESTNDYLDALVMAIEANKEKAIDKNQAKHFFENLTDYLSPNAKKLNFWKEFQTISRSREQHHLENIRFEKLDKTSIEAALKDVVGQLAIEVVKQTPNVQLLCYYRPERAIIENYSYDDIYHLREDKEKAIAWFNSWPEKVKIENERQMHDRNNPIHDLFLNKEELKGKVRTFEYDLDFTRTPPWEEKGGIAEKTPIINLFSSKKINLVDKDTRLLNATNPVEYISDYVEAINDFVRQHGTTLYDPIYRKDFVENIWLYVPFEERGLRLGKDFQQISRKMKEFSFEHFLENDYGEIVISSRKQLTLALKKMAVEIAKENLEIQLFIHYDTSQFRTKELEFFLEKTREHAKYHGLMIDFLDQWQSLNDKEKKKICNKKHVIKDVYFNYEELKNRIFFFDNQNLSTEVPWKRPTKEDFWKTLEKNQLTEVVSLQNESEHSITDYSPKELYEQMKFIDFKQQILTNRIPHLKSEETIQTLTTEIQRLDKQVQLLSNEVDNRGSETLEKLSKNLSQMTEEKIQNQLKIVNDYIRCCISLDDQRKSPNPWKQAKENISDELMVRKEEQKLEKEVEKNVICLTDVQLTEQQNFVAEKIRQLDQDSNCLLAKRLLPHLKALQETMKKENEIRVYIKKITQVPHTFSIERISKTLTMIQERRSALKNLDPSRTSYFFETAHNELTTVLNKRVERSQQEMQQQFGESEPARLTKLDIFKLENMIKITENKIAFFDQQIDKLEKQIRMYPQKEYLVRQKKRAIEFRQGYVNKLKDLQEERDKRRKTIGVQGTSKGGDSLQTMDQLLNRTIAQPSVTQSSSKENSMQSILSFFCKHFSCSSSTTKNHSIQNSYERS